MAAGPFLEGEKLPVRRKAYCFTAALPIKAIAKSKEEQKIHAISQANIGPLAMKRKLSSLTSREREVLELLTNGESNRELAQRLGVSPRTIQKHLQRIYAKLGVKRRMAAVFAVRRNAHGDSAPKPPEREETGQ